MTIIRLVVGLTLPIFVVACDNRTPAPEGGPIDAKTSVEPAAAIHSAAGKVTAIAADQITIAHGPVEELGWPAMTMTFRVAKREAIADLKGGDQVSFEFRKAAIGYALTSISRIK